MSKEKSIGQATIDNLRKTRLPNSYNLPQNKEGAMTKEDKGQLGVLLRELKPYPDGDVYVRASGVIDVVYGQMQGYSVTPAVVLERIKTIYKKAWSAAELLRKLIKEAEEIEVVQEPQEPEIKTCEGDCTR